ncbi:ATP-dependent zinc metalloprotease FtsH [Patescibacteria group bacterium]|nr:ATP-dependent zinc metalloprotease FtsH [Patescibacteria group bacterium]MBU2633173.1 ATP-dependent zinc metalloprotease FtsH [Patescibacteria group bacterium]
MVLLIGGYSLLAEQSGSQKEEISLSALAGEIENENISKILVKGDTLEISFKDGTEKISKKESESALTQTFFNYGVSQKKLSLVDVEIENPSGFAYWLGNILPFLLPFLFILLFFWFIARQAKSSALQAFSFGQSKAKIIGPNDKKEKITFKDVAGVEEAKEELKEIVDFLKSPQKFLDIGASIPKGVLLMGAPGTGKTLLARAVAGEAGVPFFHISGSEFVEMFVGVGASRVRDLFKAAKKAAPAIIFVDEIDAVGRHRGTGLGGGHDEREQTLNQILVELDGFEPHEKVIVMAATNRPDVLDPALLRPGRFDRRVILDLPDIKDREEILKIHARKKPLSEDINLKHIAERTPGFSGADLQNLMNEGAILAARNKRKEIEQDDVVRSIEKVMMGPERKSHILNEEEKKIASYHEAGHALATAALPNADPVHKVSIIARGRAAGYTLKLPIQEKHLYAKSHFLDELVIAMGGYASEKIVFGEMTTGAENDLKQATSIARALVTRYGMSEKIGPVSLDEQNEMVFLGKELGMNKDYSEEVAALVDKEVSRFLGEAYDRSKNILEKHRDALDAIAEKLMKQESIERVEFEEMMAKFNIVKKRA